MVVALYRISYRGDVRIASPYHSVKVLAGERNRAALHGACRGPQLAAVWQGDRAALRGGHEGGVHAERGICGAVRLNESLFPLAGMRSSMNG